MLWSRYRALVSALPAQLAAVQSVLTVLATQVVPLLPEVWAVRAAAWLVLATGWVAAAITVVSNVTRVPASAVGLVLAPGEVLETTLTAPSGRTSTVQTTGS